MNQQPILMVTITNTQETIVTPFKEVIAPYSEVMMRLFGISTLRELILSLEDPIFQERFLEPQSIIDLVRTSTLEEVKQYSVGDEWTISVQEGDFVRYGYHFTRLQKETV